MSESTDRLEREAEATRQQLAATAETLRDRMTPGQLLDEFSGYFRGGNGSSLVHNLGAQVRDNPLPLALIGAGFAWLMAGGGPAASRLRPGSGGDVDDMAEAMSQRTDRYPPYVDYSPGSQSRSGNNSAEAIASGYDTGSESYGDKAARMKEKAGEAFSSVADRASSATSSVSEAASSAGAAVRGAAGNTGRHLAGTGRSAVSGTTRAGERVRRKFTDVLHEEPLIIGAIGVAVGTAIAAFMPRTEIEDKYIGPYRDDLRDKAGDKVQESWNEAKEAASEAYEAASSEAERQGLLPEGDEPAARKLGKVAEAATDAASARVQDKMHDG